MYWKFLRENLKGKEKRMRIKINGEIVNGKLSAPSLLVGKFEFDWDNDREWKVEKATIMCTKEYAHWMINNERVMTGRFSSCCCLVHL